MIMARVGVEVTASTQIACHKVASIGLMCLLYFAKELLPASEAKPWAVEGIEGKQWGDGDCNG